MSWLAVGSQIPSTALSQRVQKIHKHAALVAAVFKTQFCIEAIAITNTFLFLWIDSGTYLWIGSWSSRSILQFVVHNPTPGTCHNVLWIAASLSLWKGPFQTRVWFLRHPSAKFSPFHCQIVLLPPKLPTHLSSSLSSNLCSTRFQSQCAVCQIHGGARQQQSDDR